jgi:hypothetical protein
MARSIGVCLIVGPLLCTVVLFAFWKDLIVTSQSVVTTSEPGMVSTDLNIDLNWVVVVPLLVCFLSGLGFLFLFAKQGGRA